MLMDFRYKSGIFYLKIIAFFIVNLFFIGAVFVIFNVESKDNLIAILVAVGILISLAPMTFITLSEITCVLEGETEKETAGKIIGKDFAYLGLSPHNDHPKYYHRSTSERNPEAYFNSEQIFNEEGSGKPNSLFKKALFYPSYPEIVNLKTNIKFFEEKLILDGNKITSNQIGFLTQTFKLEKKTIKKLKKENLEQAYSFSTGLPLSTYLLICSGYDNVVERALFFKYNEATPAKTFMVNKLAGSYENLVTLFDMPESWLLKMTGSFTNNSEMESHLV
jgi:hypothetical protein